MSLLEKFANALGYRKIEGRDKARPDTNENTSKPKVPEKTGSRSGSSTKATSDGGTYFPVGGGGFGCDGFSGGGDACGAPNFK